MLDWMPEQQSGDWKIEHFEITKEQAGIYAIGCYGSYERPPLPGKYIRLMHNKTGLWMSDTRQEINMMVSLKFALRDTPGKTLNVLINGLGLGIATKWALESGRHVRVIEIEQDVINMVYPVLDKLFPKQLEVVCANALEYKPERGENYDIVYHDIWRDQTLDNWEQYKLLHRRWGRHCLWQDSWARDRMKQQLRQNRQWA